MLDFTSSHYLGLRHPSDRLAGWRSITTGVPAALRTAAGTHALERRVASLCATDAASLATSTLHVVWDLFGQLADERVALFVDEGAYATLDWGAERAAGRGVPVRRFAHHDPDALARAVSAERSGRPIVVAADGLCPRCGRAAPVDDYLAAAARPGSRLVLDDTQAMGIAGPAGGGTLRACHPRDPRVLVIASFAKGFAAPVAVLAGSATAVAGYERASACRVHSSPPSVAALRTLDRALRINQATGDVLRARLAHRIDAFRAGIAALGIEPAGRPFPVQRVTVPGVDALGLSEQLACMGVRTAVAAGLRGPELLFVLRADHRPTDLGRALAALARAADLAMV